MTKSKLNQIIEEVTSARTLRSRKLLDHLTKAGIDAAPARDDRGIRTGELVLFFADDKFVISVDPRIPNVWLKGAHSQET